MENILFDYISKHITLTEEEKKAITELDIFKSVKKGTILLKEGERSTVEYFVLKGCLRTFYLIDGQEKTTAFYTEMEGVTPACLYTKGPSEYYISCVEDSIVTISGPDIEDEMFKKFPRFESLCRILSEELLVKSQGSFDQFKNSSPDQRYQNLLEARPDLVQRVPQHQLASYLGIAPQSLSRLKARLMKKKK